MRVYRNKRVCGPDGKETPHRHGYKQRLRHLKFAKESSLNVHVILLIPKMPAHKVKERETVNWKMRVESVECNGDSKLVRVEEKHLIEALPKGM